MPKIDWTKLSDVNLTDGGFVIRERLEERPWILAVGTLHDVTRLRITATGSWKETKDGTVEFPPDGVPRGSFLSPAAIPDCPVGALIGKFGGSSAALKAALPAEEVKEPAVIAEGQAFAIGSYCIVPLPPKSIGPLFVGFNGLGRPIWITELSLTIEGATPST